MSDTGDKEVSFGSASGKRFANSAAKRVFNEIDSAFGKSAMTVKIVPMVSGARNTGIKSKIFNGIGISAFVGIVSAGVITDTDRINRAFDFDRFMADIFEPEGTVFASANAMINKRRFIFGTKGSAVVIKVGMSRVGVTGVKGNTDSVEVKIIFEHGVDIVFVKRSISEKSMVSTPKMRVSGEESPTELRSV
jgi:hypothetical protein